MAICSPEEKTTPRSPNPQPTQSNSTSEKSCKTEKVKRFRKKKEFIRANALVPDTIRMSNYISCSRMSSKIYKSRCKSLTKKCKEEEICVAHKSWNKLRNISTNLKKILAQSDELSSDWLQSKKIYLGNYGYLDLAVNFPEIWEEIELINKLTRSFNESRIMVNKFKNTILNHYINSGNPFSIKERSSPPSTPHPIATRLSKSFTYCSKVFKKISIRAFLSEHIREILSEWENNPSSPINTIEAADTVLDYIKMEYPKLKDWSNKKLLTRIIKY